MEDSGIETARVSPFDGYELTITPGMPLGHVANLLVAIVSKENMAKRRLENCKHMHFSRREIKLYSIEKVVMYLQELLERHQQSCPADVGGQNKIREQLDQYLGKLNARYSPAESAHLAERLRECYRQLRKIHAMILEKRDAVVQREEVYGLYDVELLLDYFWECGRDVSETDSEIKQYVITFIESCKAIYDRLQYTIEVCGNILSTDSATEEDINEARTIMASIDADLDRELTARPAMQYIITDIREWLKLLDTKIYQMELSIDSRERRTRMQHTAQN